MIEYGDPDCGDHGTSILVRGTSSILTLARAPGLSYGYRVLLRRWCSTRRTPTEVYMLRSPIFEINHSRVFVGYWYCKVCNKTTTAALSKDSPQPRIWEGRDAI